jgi:hypothetical protein
MKNQINIAKVVKQRGAITMFNEIYCFEKNNFDFYTSYVN